MPDVVDPKITIYLVDRGVEYSLSLGTSDRLAKAKAYLATLLSTATGPGSAPSDRIFYGLNDQQHAALKRFLHSL